MGILGIQIQKENTLKEIKKQYSQIQKKLSSTKYFRPENRERFRDVLSAQDNVLIPLYPFEESTLNDLALHSDALRIGLNALSNRIFRRGFKIIAKSENSDRFQETKLNQLIKKINNNKQSIKILSQQFEWDLDVMDNAYLVAIKDYFFINGKIIDELTKTKEIIRASPIKMRLVSDFQGNLGITPEGNKLYCSPDNRSITYTEEQAKNLGFRDKLTGNELRQVFYRAEKEQGQYFYYYNDEVFFTSKHNPSLIYGYSNIFSCFDDKTEILTNNGWKLFENLESKDKVATLNPDTEEIEYQQPIKYQKFHKDEKLYRIKRNGVDLLVTKDHKMVVKKDKEGYKKYRDKQPYEFLTPEEIEGKKYQYFKGGNWKGQEEKYFVLPSINYNYKNLFSKGSRWNKDQVFQDKQIESGTKTILMNDWLEFLGYYLSKGHSQKNRASVHLAQFKEIYSENYDKIINNGKKIAGTIGANYSITNIGITIYSKQLYDYLSQFGKSKDKHIPQESLNLSKKQLRILFEALMLGGGCESGRDYFTVSERLANNFQELCLKCGYSGDIHYSEKINRYSIRIRNYKSRNTDRLIVNKFRKDDSWEDYKGYVYDVTVPKHHTLYVRRNGKAVWSGNCWMKILTLIYMDRFLMNAYRRGRPPRGLLTIGTTNYQSLKKAWEELKAKTREDPHSIEPLAYEVSQNNRGGSVNWIDLMKPLTEMQYIESRNEFRRSILAIWGIMPLFAGDVTSSGGLNSEGEQITVSDIAVEKGQKIFNDSVYPWILSQFGITDWELVLEEPEEADELEDTKVLSTKIDNAQKMAQMGFGVTYYPKEKDFEFSEKPTQSQQGFSPFGQPFNQSDFIDLSKELKENKEYEKICGSEESISGYCESNIYKSIDYISKLYNFEKSLIGENFNKFINKDLEDVLIDRISKQIWDRTFKGMTLDLSNKVKEVLIDGIVENLTLNEVTKKITNLGIDKIQAETIIRTESTRIQNSARETMFEELGIEKVFWQISHDSRVSDVCKEVHEKTKQGVTMSELKRIAHEVAKSHGLKPTGWVLHPNERSSLGIM